MWKPCTKNIELKIFVSKDSSEVGWKTGWWWIMAVLFQQHVNKALQILYLSSQYDGGNIEQRTIGYGCRQNQEAKPVLSSQPHLER